MRKQSLSVAVAAALAATTAPAFAGVTVYKDDDEAAEKDDGQSGLQLNALQADDQAWAVLPPRKIQNVLIITPGNLFLHKVFEANPLARVTVQKELPEIWPSDSLVVLHRNVPDSLPTGDVFIVDPRNGCDVFEVG